MDGVQGRVNVELLSAPSFVCFLVLAHQLNQSHSVLIERLVDFWIVKSTVFSSCKHHFAVLDSLGCLSEPSKDALLRELPSSKKATLLVHRILNERLADSVAASPWFWPIFQCCSVVDLWVMQVVFSQVLDLHPRALDFLSKPQLFLGEE